MYSTGFNIIFGSNIGINKALKASNITQLSLQYEEKQIQDNNNNLFVQLKYHNAYQNILFTIFSYNVKIILNNFSVFFFFLFLYRLFVLKFKQNKLFIEH